ncbi:lytic polysaccharide monooxygenase [Sphaerobolus stellatus SS14]|uniref:lytic cellulose monooxygenase (C4-dehydrogenating) n=1 Tax=Sphaerobolus stellatus (strain SS14) TaxID=990650 RepID=A0A0C9VLN7_SPHS4|nr:lytic polysaccharide monooxygenase [Sphaerobolus stellatus SS14]
MKSTVIFFALAASLVPSVLSHGFLASVAIDGKVYKGNNPDFFANPSLESPIRLVDTIEPVKGATNLAVNCGSNAQAGKLIADANPGSNVAFNWSGGSSEHWPHNIGPVLTYLATCGNVTCDKFDPTNAQWFKIDEVGQKPENLSEWFQKNLFLGQSLTVTIPKATVPGNYLIRHEIIALHNSEAPGGAEFYPSCTQLRIGQGNGTAVSPSRTVLLPGAYSDTDPGILVPTIFNPVQNYQFPGPGISNVVNATGSAVTNSNGAASSTTSNSTTSSTKSPSCKRSVHPRRVSRVMADRRAKRQIPAWFF